MRKWTCQDCGGEFDGKEIIEFEKECQKKGEPVYWLIHCPNCKSTNIEIPPEAYPANPDSFDGIIVQPDAMVTILSEETDSNPEESMRSQVENSEENPPKSEEKLICIECSAPIWGVRGFYYESSKYRLNDWDHSPEESAKTIFPLCQKCGVKRMDDDYAVWPTSKLLEDPIRESYYDLRQAYFLASKAQNRLRQEKRDFKKSVDKAVDDLSAIVEHLKREVE